MLNGTWYSHPPVIRRNRLPTFSTKKTLCKPPNHPWRATVYSKGSQIVWTGSAEVLPPPTPCPSTFTGYLTQSQHIQWCLDSLVILNEGKDLVEALQTGMTASVMAISDGSYKKTYGTAAWTMHRRPRRNDYRESNLSWGP
jgi:hypothetical protein